MGRLRRLAAFVRVLLVAVGLCLLGAGHATATTTTVPGLDVRPAHCAGVDLPDPGPLLAEERDAPERVPLEDDATVDPPPAPGPVAAAPRRIALPRGPPGASPAASGRPRSSRGPPDPV